MRSMGFGRAVARLPCWRRLVDDRAASRLDNPAPDSGFAGAHGAAVKRMTSLMTRTKVGQEHFVRFAEIGVDALVTDGEIKGEAGGELEAAGSEVVRA